MQAAIVQPRTASAGSELRTLVLASIGGALEFYDFVIFVFFTSAIAKLFFAASEPEWIRQTQTFGIFAAGYLARPLGGIVMAHFGDTRGRKRMFTLSISLMAFATLSIGLLPTYQSIGVAAPLLLLVMRLLQGAAIGGEASGAWVFVAEHARETPVFKEMQKRAALSRVLPLGAVLKNHGQAVAASFVSNWMLTAAIVVVILMTPSLIAKSSGLLPGELQLANLAATAALCASAVTIGAATDRFGVRQVAIPILLLLIAATYGLYLSAERLPSVLLPLYLLAGFGAGGVVLTPITMVRAFPTAIRFSGVSFSYNIAYAVFGGLTPLFVAWLMHLNPIGPAHYIAAVTVAGLGGIFLAPLTHLGGSDRQRVIRGDDSKPPQLS